MKIVDKKTGSVIYDGITGMQMQKVVSQGEDFGKALTGNPMQPLKPSVPSGSSAQQPQVQQPQSGGTSPAKQSE